MRSSTYFSYYLYCYYILLIVYWYSGSLKKQTKKKWYTHIHRHTHTHTHTHSHTHSPQPHKEAWEVPLPDSWVLTYIPSVKITYTKLGRQKRKKAIILIFQWQGGERAEAKVEFTELPGSLAKNHSPWMVGLWDSCVNSWNSYISWFPHSQLL